MALVLSQTFMVIPAQAASKPGVAPTKSSHRSWTAKKFNFHKDYGQLPLAFESNEGQSDSRVRYVAHGSGYALFLTDLETVMALNRYDFSVTNAKNPKKRSKAPPLLGRDVLRLSFTGGSRGVVFETANELPGTSNYFIGKDKSQWHTHLRQYGQVIAHDVYPGIDMAYYGTNGQLEYDFHVKPGADPSVIRVKHEGADSAVIDGSGNLVLSIGNRTIRFKAPTVYQEDNGAKTTLQGSYVSTGANEIGFQIADYDKTKTLVIDPALDYSSYFGGNVSDQCQAIAVTSGGVYLTGQTSSTNFPTSTGSTPYQSGNNGTTNAFVAQINTTLSGTSSLVYSTYLGGGSTDVGMGIAVDGSGNAYVTGYTNSSSSNTAFPTTAGAYQSNLGGAFAQNAFVSSIAPGGSNLNYSTYLGGSGSDAGLAIAVDNSNNVFVTGYTQSSNFPTNGTNTPYQTTYEGNQNAFVAEINTTLSGTASLIYSTYLGGGNISTADGGSAIAIDASDNIYVAGSTSSGRGGSPAFPTTAGAYQASLAGSQNAFVAIFSSVGALNYSTYLGGGGSDTATGIALDSSHNIYITGSTSSSGGTPFPTTSGAYQTTLAGTQNAFLTILNSSGASLNYSTYLGGGGSDSANAIALDSSNNLYVTGTTTSNPFPTTAGAYQTSMEGTATQVAFVSMINPGGNGTSDLFYSSYLGGNGTNGVDQGNGIALDTTGDVYVAGYTGSSDFPSANAYQGTEPNTANAGFITEFDVTDFYTATPTNTSTNTATSTATNTATNTATQTATNTATQTLTNTAVNTDTPTNTFTNTPLNTNTATNTPTNTVNNTSTITNTPTLTPSNTPAPTICVYNFTGQWPGSTNIAGGTNVGAVAFANPEDVAADNNHNVYVADTDNSLIQKFDANGNFLTSWSGSAPALSNPEGVAVDSQANIYVSDTGNNLIQIFNSTGILLGQISSSFNNPAGLAVTQSAGTTFVYVADQTNSVVKEFSSVTGFAFSPTNQLTGFSAPEGVAFDGLGNVFVIDKVNNLVSEYTMAGSFENSWNGLSTGGTLFNGPEEVAVDSANNVYVADTGNNIIQIFNNAGGYIGQFGGPGAGSGMFNEPSGLTVDVSGNLYVADMVNGLVQKFNNCNTLNTATITSTVTNTVTATITNTPADTNTFTNTFTATQTYTVTMTPTISNTPTVTFTDTITNTPASTSTFTNTTTVTATNTITNTPTISSTPTISPTITNTPNSTPTVNISLALGANRFNCLSDPPLRIDYWILNGGSTQIRVYNAAGITVRHLLYAFTTVGAYTTYWDGKDDGGQPTHSGLYLVVLTEPNRMDIKKVAVVME